MKHTIEINEANFESEVVQSNQPVVFREWGNSRPNGRGSQQARHCVEVGETRRGSMTQL